MRYTLVNQSIAGAATLAIVPSSRLQLNDGAKSVSVQASLNWGSGGTSVTAYLQTSFDNGSSWVDVACFSFTTASARYVFNLSSLTPVTTEYTPTDGGLAANTSKDGVLGNLFQVKLQSSGTYANTSLRIDAVAQER